MDAYKTMALSRREIAASGDVSCSLIKLAPPEQAFDVRQFQLYIGGAAVIALA